jgi:hypothetical protein
MQQLTSTTVAPAPPRWSLWIDRAHQHRLVEVVQIVDEELVRPQPIRDSRQQPPSYPESSRRLELDYERVSR